MLSIESSLLNQFEYLYTVELTADSWPMTSFHSDWLLVGSGAHLVAVYASEAEANPSDFGTANLLDLIRLLPSIHELPQPA